jgi:hypothetical protein
VSDKEDLHRAYSRGYAVGARERRRAPPASDRTPLHEHQASEVEWYRQYGRYQDRIRLDIQGREYVIGDFSWNVRGRPAEVIEQQMTLRLTQFYP